MVDITPRGEGKTPFPQKEALSGYDGLTFERLPFFKPLDIFVGESHQHWKRNSGCCAPKRDVPASGRCASGISHENTRDVLPTPCGSACLRKIFASASTLSISSSVRNLGCFAFGIRTSCFLFPFCSSYSSSFTTRCQMIVRILRATATIALANPSCPTFLVKNA